MAMSTNKLAAATVEALTADERAALRSAYRSAKTDAPFLAFVGSIVELAKAAGTRPDVASMRQVLRGYLHQSALAQRIVVGAPLVGDKADTIRSMADVLVRESVARVAAGESENKSTCDLTPGRDGGVLLAPIHTAEEMRWLKPIVNAFAAMYAIKSEQAPEQAGTMRSEFFRVFKAKLLAISEANLQPGQSLPPEATLDKLAASAWHAWEALAAVGCVFAGFHYAAAADNPDGAALHPTAAAMKIAKAIKQSGTFEAN